jgi:hypothetical protein
MEAGILHFGVLPCFLNGERGYHYNIDIGQSKFNLIGFFNANGTATILFRLDRDETGRPLSDGDRMEFRNQYASLAAFLLQHGFPADFRLDETTTSVLTEYLIMENRPCTLRDIVTLE